MPTTSIGCLPWPQRIRAVAISLVLVTHLAAPYVVAWHETAPFSFWLAHLITSLSRVCVPLFIMLSGALLLGTEKTKRPGTFFLRRWNKVGWEWLVWGSVLLIYRLSRIESHGIVTTLKLFITTYITGFWFITQLFILYALTPLFNQVLQKVHSKYAVYFAIFSLAVGNTLVWTSLFFYQEKLVPFIQISSYSGYYFLGYLVRVWLENRKLETDAKKIMWFMWVVGAVCTFFGTYIAGKLLNGYSLYFYDYSAFNVVLMTVPIFILLMKGSWSSSFSRLLSAHSFSIFLIHTVLLELVSAHSVLWSNMQVAPLIITVPIQMSFLLGLSLSISLLTRWIWGILHAQKG